MDPHLPQRSSLVDDTEMALRAWLATGTHRPGDRLPPELELAGMLGVSRGTLRTALDRLEEAGEITRRQGSGTYVGQAVRPTAFHEGLEVLRPYSELAERRGVALTVRELEIAELRIGAEAGEAFALPPDTEAWTITRTILADGEPVAMMRDIVRPGHPAAAREAAAARDRERRHGARRAARAGRAGRVRRHARAAAAAERAASGPAARSASRARRRCSSWRRSCTSARARRSSTPRTLFAPGGIDLQVRRNLEVAAPAPLVRAIGRT